MANGWKKGLHIDKDIIPKKLGIPAKIYSPEMCSIVTRKENNLTKRNNRMGEYNGRMLSLKEVTEELGLKYGSVHSRLRRGWTFQEAISGKQINQPQEVAA